MKQGVTEPVDTVNGHRWPSVVLQLRVRRYDPGRDKRDTEYQNEMIRAEQLHRHIPKFSKANKFCY